VEKSLLLLPRRLGLYRHPGAIALQTSAFCDSGSESGMACSPLVYLLPRLPHSQTRAEAIFIKRLP
jgi:hypothetical protein